jgi:hypothetical protein
MKIIRIEITAGSGTLRQARHIQSALHGNPTSGWQVAGSSAARRRLLRS